jgi:hypothetical protein
MEGKSIKIEQEQEAFKLLSKHNEELKEFIFIKIEIRRNSYEKLEQIANLISKSPVKVIENLIGELYKHLQEEGDL